MEKFLPIKFFDKRKVDELQTEGGPMGNPPKWVLQGNDLSEHSMKLSGCMTEVSAEYEEYKKEEHVLPMVMATTIIDGAIAKSHRRPIADLLESDGNANIIGLDTIEELTTTPSDDYPDTMDRFEKSSEKNRILSIVASNELITNIQRALQDTQGAAKLISSIYDIRPYKAKCADYNPENTAYRVYLFDYHEAGRNELVQKLFKNQCQQNGITITRETRYSSDMHLFRVTLDSAEEMQTVRQFEGVQLIEEAVPISADLDSFDEISMPAIKRPKDGETYPTVGVLDSGIGDNQYLSPWLLDESESYYEEYLQNKSHGSMVASVLEYSDELNGTDYTATDGVMMLEAIVAPDTRKEKFYPDDLIDNVRNAIERHPNVKIWTLSAGTTEECDPMCFSQYGMALDNIEDENHVLIIKSAGNSTVFAKNRNATERIAKMADSVRSLVVGSIAGEKGKYDYADIDMPSPFTRTGPGPAYIIKPDLVAYGGNAGKTPDGKLTTTGVKVLNAAGELSRAPGTSFSTPWVARIASELAFLLDGEFDPLLIKALMIHSAGYPAGERMKMDEKKKFMGFGMPRGTRDILYNSENEITLVLRDTLEKGSFIEIFDFPFSKSLVGDDGMYHGQIVLTLVCSPILRPSDGPEYCQTNINVAFGTMDGIQERDTSKRTVKNPYGPDNGKNLLNDSLYSSKVFNVLEDEVFGRERTLLKYGQKYYPVKKYAINLDELTPKNQEKALNGEKQWYMKIEGFYRDAIEREAKETGEKLSQDFCLLLTIRDPSGKAPVYTEITQQLQQKNFVYYNVQLRNEIREHVRIEEGTGN